MEGVQEQAVNDLFQGAEIMNEECGRSYQFNVSYYEIYGGKVYDLLNNHQSLKLLEDKNGNITVAGILMQEASSPREMLDFIKFGAQTRTTHATAANDTSSRSHAICTIQI